MRLQRKTKLNSMFNGITLVESILYLALFAMIFVVIIQFSLSVSEGNRIAKDAANFELSTVSLSRHMQNTMKYVESIDDVNTVFENDNGHLYLLENGNTYEYFLQNQQLYYSDNGVVSKISTNENNVSKLNIEKVQLSDGTVAGVRVTIRVESLNDSDRNSEFTTTLLLRSY